MPFAPASVCTDGGQRQLTSPVGWRSLESCVPALTPALRTAHSLLVIRNQGSSSEQGSNFTLHPSFLFFSSFHIGIAAAEAKRIQIAQNCYTREIEPRRNRCFSPPLPVSSPQDSNFTLHPSLLFFSSLLLGISLAEAKRGHTVRNCYTREENEPPELLRPLKADIPASSRANPASSRVDFASSRVKFASSRGCRGSSRVNLASSGVDFASSRGYRGTSRMIRASSRMSVASSRISVASSRMFRASSRMSVDILDDRFGTLANVQSVQFMITSILASIQNRFVRRFSTFESRPETFPRVQTIFARMQN